MGLGFSPRGLWCALCGLYSAGQGCWDGEGWALVYPELYLYVPSYTYQYPRGSHTFRATIIIERDCYQLVAVRYEFPR